METPRWLPRVLFESALIVFSVLLALGINEWQEERETAAQVALALENVRAELLANEREIRDAYPYHTTLKDTLFALAAADVPEITGDLYPRGLIVSADVTSTAWQSAQTTGAVAAMPYDIVLELSKAYAEQSRYRRWTDDVMQSLYDFVLREGLAAVNQEYDRVAGLINDISSWEGRLLRPTEARCGSWNATRRLDRATAPTADPGMDHMGSRTDPENRTSRSRT